VTRAIHRATTQCAVDTHVRFVALASAVDARTVSVALLTSKATWTQNSIACFVLPRLDTLADTILALTMGRAVFGAAFYIAASANPTVFACAHSILLTNTLARAVLGALLPCTVFTLPPSNTLALQFILANTMATAFVGAHNVCAARTSIPGLAPAFARLMITFTTARAVSWAAQLLTVIAFEALLTNTRVVVANTAEVAVLKAAD